MSIDKIANSNNLSYKNQYIKVTGGLIALLVALIVDSKWIQASIILLSFLLLSFLGGINWRQILRLYKLPLGFLILSSVAILVNISKDYSKMEYYFNLGSIYIGTNKGQIHELVRVLIRSLACVSATYFIALSTPINQMIELMKKIRLPNIFIEQFMLIYRFINLFMDEFYEMNRAAELKNGYVNAKTMIKTTSQIAIGLFFKTMGRYGDWKNSLELKLFDEKLY